MGHEARVINPDYILVLRYGLRKSASTDATQWGSDTTSSGQRRHLSDPLWVMSALAASRGWERTGDNSWRFSTDLGAALVLDPQPMRRRLSRRYRAWANDLSVEIELDAHGRLRSHRYLASLKSRLWESVRWDYRTSMPTLPSAESGTVREWVTAVDAFAAA